MVPGGGGQFGMVPAAAAGGLAAYGIHTGFNAATEAFRAAWRDGRNPQSNPQFSADPPSSPPRRRRQAGRSSAAPTVTPGVIPSDYKPGIPVFMANFAPGELKFFDSTHQHLHDHQGDTVNYVFVDLLKIPLGDGPSSRSGRQICVKSIHLRGTIQFEQGAVPDTFSARDNSWRGMLVHDKQCNGSAILAQDLREANIGLITNHLGDPMNQFYNLNEIPNRYNILWDEKRQKPLELIDFEYKPSDSTVQFFHKDYLFHVEHNWHGNMVVDYDNSTTDGGLTSIRTNNVFIASMTHTSDANHHCLVKIVIRVRFIEC